MLPNCLLSFVTTTTTITPQEGDEAAAAPAAPAAGTAPRRQILLLCKAKTIRSCLVWTLEVLILIMFCLGLTVLVEFVVVHPQPPKCDIISLVLSNFSTSSMNANDASSLSSASSSSSAADNCTSSSSIMVPVLTAVIAVTIKAHNQIKRIGTFYDHVHVMVLYNRDLIGEDWVEPFYQGRSNTDLLQTRVEVHNLPVSQDTGIKLLADIEDQSVEFEVTLHVVTRVRILNIITHHFRVHVKCNITVTPITGTNKHPTLLSKICTEKTHWLSNH